MSFLRIRKFLLPFPLRVRKSRCFSLKTWSRRPRRCRTRNLFTWLPSALCIALTYLSTWLVLGGQGAGLWLRLATIITCGTLAGALIPELVKVFTSTGSQHVRETVKSSRQGGASLNILSGVVAGDFSAFWLGITVVGLMGGAFLLS